MYEQNPRKGIQTIVISGATSEIGRALIRRLLLEGWTRRILCITRETQRCRDIFLNAGLEDSERRIEVVEANLADPEMTEAVLYLLGDAAEWVTGAVLSVDGGLSS